MADFPRLHGRLLAARAGATLVAAASAGAPPIPDGGNEVIGETDAPGILPEGRDAETELRRLAAIVASSDDAIISTTLDGIITTWNRAAEAIFGYRPEEVIDRPVFLLAAPGRANEMPQILDRIGRSERIECYETVQRHKDGGEIAVSLTVSPIYDASARIVGASKIARDISKRKRAEAELRRLNEALEQRVAQRTGELKAANIRLQSEMAEHRRADARLQELQSELFHAARLGAVGQMVAALMHELNQPLAAAVNFVRASQRLLLSGGRDEIGAVAGDLDEAATEVLRAGQIMRRLREFVLRRKTERRMESLTTIIEEASALALIGAGASGVGASGVGASFVLDRKATRVFADRVQIQQVLVNLMRNAIEGMSGDGRHDLEVRTALRDGEIVEIAIADRGPGLAKDAIDHLFEPFFSTKPNGMGLGLSICRTIVEAHGGRLWSELNPGGGTIFRFTLPAAPMRGESDGP